MAFNQAMSGMHCWRMITDSSSTCARVSKGRYFPGIACLLRNRGRLLLLGVAEGNWISGLSIRKLSLLPRMEPLFIQWWMLMVMHGNMSTLRSFFIEVTVNAIRQIPVSWLGGDDFAYTLSDQVIISHTRKLSCLHGLQLDVGQHRYSILMKSNMGRREYLKWKLCCGTMDAWSMTGFQLQHITGRDECIFCGKSERAEHLFLTYPFARVVNTKFLCSSLQKSMVNMKLWSVGFLDRGSKIQHDYVLAHLISA
jgi:hypothetical protein